MTTILITYSCLGYSKMTLINVPFCNCKNGVGLKRMIRKRYANIVNTAYINFGYEKVIVTFSNAANNAHIATITI